MKIKAVLPFALLAVSAIMVSCGPSQATLDKRASQTSEARAATRTQSFVETETSKPTLTSTITPTTTKTPTQTQESLKQPLLSDIQMVSPEIGWAVDTKENYPSILRTEDGGETWFEIAQSDLRIKDTAIHAIDENTVIYTLGVFNIFDGDRSWPIYDILDDSLDQNFSIEGNDWFILNENDIWLRVFIGFRAGGAMARYRTTDGGKTWKLQDFSYGSHEPDQTLNLIMLNEYSGWAENWRPYTYNDKWAWNLNKTTDGGNTWKVVRLPRPGNLAADHVDNCPGRWIRIGAPDLLQIRFNCYNSNDWYYISPDGGVSWKIWRIEGEVFFLDLDFGWRLINQENGTAIIEATDDGGFTWEEKGIIPGQGPFQFWNELDGWTVTSDDQLSVLWITSDGGSTWEEKETFPHKASLTFFDRVHGWAYTAADDKTVVWRTKDGGETWQELTPVLVENLSSLVTNSLDLHKTPASKPVELTSIHMVDESNGWGLNKATVWITQDGGRTWREVTPPQKSPDEVRRDAYGGFLDAQHAWLLFLGRESRANQSILYTSNGGQTWNESQPLLIKNKSILSADFTIPEINTGWLLVREISAGPWSATVYRMVNEGADWNREEPNWINSEGFYRLGFSSGFPQELGFVDGQNGWLLELTMRDNNEGLSPNFHVTTDGGDAWKAYELSPPLDNPGLHLRSDHCTSYELNLLSSDIVRFLVSCVEVNSETWERVVFIYLYATEDGGLTWHTYMLLQVYLREYSEGQDELIGRLIFLDNYNGLFLDREMWRTEDGGRTWKHINTVTWDGQFSFIDPWRGWAVAESEDGEIALVYTTNGGETWQILNPIEVE